MQFWGNLLFFLLWVPVVHKRLLPTVSLGCMFRDAWVPGAVVILSFFVFAKMFHDSLSGIFAVFFIGATFMVAVALGIASGNLSRPFVISLLRGVIR